MEATPYPMDFSVLQKGSVVTNAEVARAMDIAEDHPRFWAKALKLAAMIEEAFAECHNQTVTVRVLRDGIHVLTDEEASRYNDSRLHRTRSAQKRHVGKLVGVDPSNLPASERERHERIAGRWVSYYKATVDAARTFLFGGGRPELPKREVPKVE